MYPIWSMTEWSQLAPDEIIPTVCAWSKRGVGSWGCFPYPSLSLSVEELTLQSRGCRNKSQSLFFFFLPQFNFFFRFPLHQAVWKHLGSPVCGHPGFGSFGVGSSPCTGYYRCDRCSCPQALSRLAVDSLVFPFAHLEHLCTQVPGISVLL